MIKLIRKILNSLGCDVVRYPHLEDSNFLKLLNRLEIDTLFDVGANVGQFAIKMREIGYENRIISFEPLNEAFHLLEKRTKDSNWIICHSAVGSEDGIIDINVSQNLVSSSVLFMNNNHLEAAPRSIYLKKESVSICKIDSIFSEYAAKGANVFIKIDTQGFEKNVIEGALCSLPCIKGFIMELSFITLYEGETLFFDMISYMESLGYEMWQIMPGFVNSQNQRQLQADVVFVRKE